MCATRRYHIQYELCGVVNFFENTGISLQHSCNPSNLVQSLVDKVVPFHVIVRHDYKSPPWTTCYTRCGAACYPPSTKSYYALFGSRDMPLT